MDFLELFYKTVETVIFYEDVENKNKYYAEFTDGKGDVVFAKIKSKAFKSYLYMTSIEIDDEGKGLDIKKSIELLNYYFIYNGSPEKVKVSTRVSGSLLNGVEYDLQNEAQLSVIVNEEGWKLGAKKSKFLVPCDSLPQTVPKKSKNSIITLIGRLVNLKGDNLLLFVVWLLHCFISGSHIALLLNAEAGSGKTTLCKIARRIIDPSSLDIIRFPDCVEDLCVVLTNSYFVCFDNMTVISKSASDVLCGSITGSATVKRKKYSDADLSIQKMHNPLLLNGIEIMPEESDLADRLLVIEMKRLKNEKRTTDSSIFEELEKRLPYILGAIFTTLSDAMKEYKSIDQCSPHRMMDGALNMIAIAKALGVDEDYFRNLLKDNRQKINQNRLCNPVVEAVVEYMNRPGAKATESGMCQELYTRIKINYSGTKSAIGGSASIFSRRLNQEYEALHAHGISFLLKKSANGTELTLTKK